MGAIENIQLFNVAPAVPKALSFLEDLPFNLWWCWTDEAIDLFRRIDPLLWRDTGHNPIDFLNRLGQKRLETLTDDEGFMRHLQRVQERFQNCVARDEPTHSARTKAQCAAYFSLEYGIHESIGMYSGGLGVLSGDHVKAASDMGLPLVAVGLLYRQGYFQQYLNHDGWQQETYPEYELHRLPLKRVCDAEHRQIHITLPLPNGTMRATAWRLDVGRVPLFLLDTNIPENPSDIRQITAQLYVQDRRQRLRQELLLGLGGTELLRTLGYNLQVLHMNEGHTAFAGVGRLADLIRDRGLDLETAREIVFRGSVFTTHTPVPAGNESFSVDLLRPHMEALQPKLGLDPATIVSWGLPKGGPKGAEFSMTVLGFHMAMRRNGVSRLHGEVARKMWSSLWPGRAEDEVPIHYVTNGVHVSSWLSPDSGALYDRYLGPDWKDHPAAMSNLSHVDHIPDEELWHAHEIARSRLVRTARELMAKQYAARNATRADMAHAKSVLDHDALTIGFARRFASYKRATLLLKDPHRLEALLCDSERPIQLVFAGKAHPADDLGKDLIRQIIHFAQNSKVRRRIIFLENYNIYIARCLVQGVDVWLNTPQRPHEASGTSGMKAAINGGIHTSVLDGWWCEGFSKECGWAIGNAEEYDDPKFQDDVEAQALYNLLENEIVPTFYDRSAGDLPTTWIHMMKASIRMALGFFTSHRMVAEYAARFYDSARADFEDLTADNAQHAVALVAQQKRLSLLWPSVSVELPATDKDLATVHVGETFNVYTTVRLGELRPDEVDVEVYSGPVNSENRVTESHVTNMQMAEDKGQGTYIYRQELACKAVGRYGFTARVTPTGADFDATIPGFVTWANGA